MNASINKQFSSQTDAFGKIHCFLQTLHQVMKFTTTIFPRMTKRIKFMNRGTTVPSVRLHHVISLGSLNHNAPLFFIDFVLVVEKDYVIII